MGTNHGIVKYALRDILKNAPHIADKHNTQRKYFVFLFSGRSGGGRPYDYDRGFNQGMTWIIRLVVVNVLWLKSQF